MIIFNPITGLSLQYYRSKWLAVLLEFFDKIYEAESSTTGKRPGPN